MRPWAAWTAGVGAAAAPPLPLGPTSVMADTPDSATVAGRQATDPAPSVQVEVAAEETPVATTAVPGTATAAAAEAAAAEAAAATAAAAAAAAAEELSSPLVSNATISPLPGNVPWGVTLQLAALFLDGTNFTDAISSRIVACSATPTASGTSSRDWTLIEASRFTPTLLQANYAVVVPEAATSRFALLWSQAVRSGSLVACAGLPDGSASASVAPFDANPVPGVRRRRVAEWIPAMLIGAAAVVTILALAMTSLARIGHHYNKADLADPDAPEWVTPVTPPQSPSGAAAASGETDDEDDDSSEPSSSPTPTPTLVPAPAAEPAATRA
ncbi:hypothetical protein MMPV_005321 [Pyropia vietnamensis]